MQFSDTTNKDGLIQDCEILLGLGDGGISGNSTLLKQFTGLINRSCEKAVDILLASNNGWEWDDTNNTNYPIGLRDLVDGQKDYKYGSSSWSLTGQEGASNTAASNTLTLLKLIRVEVKDSSGNWIKLVPLDESDVTEGLDSIYSTTGLPTYYREIADALELYPSPSSSSVTLTKGLKVIYQRVHSAYVSTDTTKVPGFSPIYHRFLSLDTSYGYAATRNMPQAAYIKDERGIMEVKMNGNLSRRNKEQKVKLRTKTKSYE